jgi:hypothetical protein
MSTAISIYRELATSKHVNLDRLGRNYLEHRLLSALASLEIHYCWLPGSAPPPVRDATVTFWPEPEMLEQLHSVVIDLFMTEHRKLPRVYWKAYTWVNNLLPKIRLVRTVDRLVARARNRLKEVGESYLMRLKRDAHEGELEPQRLLKALRAFENDASKAIKIKWENYEQLLFRQGNKPVQLVCDDLSASPRLRCYARALEIIAEDHLRYERMYPLLRWIAYIGYPNFPEVLGDTYSVMLSKLPGMMADQRKKERTKLRVARHRLKKRTARMAQ